MPPLPSAVRAALGLAATMLDEAKTLPDKALEVPMLAISKTLQFSLRAQRGYAAMAARGDELLAAHPVTDEPPAWAKFDEPTADAPIAEPIPAVKTVRAPRTGAPSAFDTVADE